MGPEVEIIFKIAAIGIITSVVNSVLKHSGKDEFAQVATLSGIIIVLYMLVNLITELFSTVKTLFTLY